MAASKSIGRVVRSHKSSISSNRKALKKAILSFPDYSTLWKLQVGSKSKLKYPALSKNEYDILKTAWQNGSMHKYKLHPTNKFTVNKLSYDEGSIVDFYYGQADERGAADGIGIVVRKQQLYSFHIHGCPANSPCLQSGEWKDGKLHGEGKEVYSNGTFYEGSFCFGQYQCFGRLEYSSGNYYEGNFYQGKFHGYGKRQKEDSYYYGQWSSGEHHGQGKYEDKGTDTWYSGKWVHGTKHGQGKTKLLDGSIYQGAFKNGTIHGYGMKAHESGCVEEGYWKDGKLIKQGTITYEDSTRSFTFDIDTIS